MHSEKSYTISEIAKELGYKSAIEFNKILHKDETVIYNLRVTQKGREFLLNKYSDDCKLISLE